MTRFKIIYIKIHCFFVDYILYLGNWRYGDVESWDG